MRCLVIYDLLIYLRYICLSVIAGVRMGFGKKKILCQLFQEGMEELGEKQEKQYSVFIAINSFLL